MTPEETTGAPEQTPEGTATPWVLDAITRASDVIIVTDQRDRIAYVNDAIRDLTGTEPADLAGEAVLALVAPKDHSRVLAVLRMARFGDEPDTQILELEFSSSLAAGPVSVELTVRPASLGKRGTGCISVGRDVSKSKAHFDERLATERVGAVIELAKNAAHQINNPLAILTVHLGVIEKATAEGKCPQPEAVDQMRNVIGRIAEVTAELAAAADTSLQKSILGAPLADLHTTPPELDPE